MRLYGFPPSILFGLVNKPAIIPVTFNEETGNFEDNVNFNSPDCTFDQFSPKLGCFAFPFPCTPGDIQVIGFPNWLSTINNQVDLRGVYSTCVNGRYVPDFVFPLDVLNTQSPISVQNVAYTT